MKIAICGSMSFSKEMLETKSALEQLGWVVEVPAGTLKYVSGERSVENKWEKLELDVFKAWYKVIEQSDAVLVLNYDKNGIAGYVGGNSLIEMAFAHVFDKKLYLLNPIPLNMSYSDEIEAFMPIVVNGDWRRIL